MGLVFVGVGCVRVAGEDNVTILVGDSIIRVGGHIVQELVNSIRCVIYGCGLLGDYGMRLTSIFFFNSLG